MYTREDIEGMLWSLRRVVAVLNGKGGVYKTTTVTNIGAAAAKDGYRVLVIDLDPQGNTLLDFYGEGKVFGPTGEILIGDEGRHLTAALQGLVPLAPVIAGVRENLDLITGGKHVRDLRSVIQGRTARGEENFSLMLASALAPLAANYDLILIDTPPVDDLLQRLALTAARWMLITTLPDSASVLGMTEIAGLLDSVRRFNPYIELAGVILAGVGKSATKVRKDAAARINTALGGVAPLFDTVIRYSVVLSVELRKQGKLTHELEDVAIATEISAEYRAAGKQLLERIAAAEAEEDQGAGEEE